MANDFFRTFEEETLFEQSRADEMRDHGWWGNTSVPEYLEQQAEQNPEKTAVVDDYRSLTFAELNEAADRFAATLVDLGVEKGDCVAHQISDRSEWFITRHGIAKAGAVTATLLPRFRENEIEHIVTTTEPNVYVGVAGFKDYDHMSDVGTLMEDVDSLETVIAVGESDDVPEWAVPFEETQTTDTLSRVELEERRIHPDYPDELATTSGTTGLPKIFYLVQNARMRLAKWWIERFNVTVDDELFLPAPIQQGFGQAWAYYVVAVMGIPVIVTEKNDPTSLWEYLDRKPTMMVAIPTQMTKMINHENAHESLDYLRCIPNGGAPLPPETAKKFDELDTMVLNGYGSNPGGAPTAVCPVDSPDVRHTTIGKRHAGADVKVINPEGEELPPGEVGEIIWDSADRLFGYYDDRERTEAEFDVDGPNEGWYHSSDAGKIDEDGNVAIVGRMDDMIIRGGQNIYPTEIENAILETGFVNEVAVVGMPDPEYGQRVCAYVVSQSDDLDRDELVDGLEEQGLAKFKWPERVESIDELPRSAGGKIQKAELVDDITEKLEAEDAVD